MLGRQDTIGCRLSRPAVIPDDYPQKNLVWVAFGRGLLHSGACKRVCAGVRLHRLAQMLTGDARAAGKAPDRTIGCRLSGPAITSPVNFITKVRAAIPAQGSWRRSGRHSRVCAEHSLAVLCQFCWCEREKPRRRISRRLLFRHAPHPHPLIPRYVEMDHQLS
jgi:hypothetical protein